MLYGQDVSPSIPKHAKEDSRPSSRITSKLKSGAKTLPVLNVAISGNAS